MPWEDCMGWRWAEHPSGRCLLRQLPHQLQQQIQKLLLTVKSSSYQNKRLHSAYSRVVYLQQADPIIVEDAKTHANVTVHTEQTS